MAKQKANNRLVEFRDRHRGETILVCGCGTSVNSLKFPVPVTTIGVNDIGRRFTPDYLVVLNAKSQFKGDRFRFVESSEARAIFTQLNLGLAHPDVVRFQLGERGGTDLSSDTRLPYTRNSPYVALCLAAFMGARRIGLIGVDFSDDHFFAGTGRHPLRRELAKINREYGKLAEALSSKGVEVFNLSRDSLLDSLPRLGAEEFFSGHRASAAADSRKRRVSIHRAATIQVEKHRGELIGGFFDELAATARELGHRVQRRVTTARPGQPTVSIVWNGRRYRGQDNMIYCEHGWLPRDAYQVSPAGINADSHLAPFAWDHKALDESQRKAVYAYLQSLKTQERFGQKYIATNGQPLDNLPGEFILVPLQLEQDTNILRHVSPRLRRMQAVIDTISRAQPTVPVIYKQHPVDAQRGGRHLRLRLRRKQDILMPHRWGNIHQVLKTGSCKAIISLNSNVVHDGFLWDVPAVVLGRNIWPLEGVSPFLTGLPRDWSELDGFYQDPTVTACREAYIHTIMTHQWYRADATDPAKVQALLEHKIEDIRQGRSAKRPAGGKLIRMPQRPHPVTSKSRSVRGNPRVTTVNVVARNKGWLFEDLKRAFLRVSLPDIRVVASDKPRGTADAWLYLRASEVDSSPDKARTLVQIHDQFDDGLYASGGQRRSVKDCAAISFTQVHQQAVLEGNGLDLAGKTVLTMPLGADRHFTLRDSLPTRFTVGWVGRPVMHQDRDFKRIEWLHRAVAAVANRDDVSVLLAGERLEASYRELTDGGIDCQYHSRSKCPHSQYPGLYRKLDCVVVTSEIAAGPNCLFEALATGVPVISTRCGWAEQLIVDGENGFLVDSPEDITRAINTLQSQRGDWYARRHAIRASLLGLSLDNWLQCNIETAAGLYRSRAPVDISAGDRALG